MRRAALLLASCVLLGAVASPAMATDASVEAAWDGDDAQFTKLGKQFRKGLRAWRKSGYRKPGRALKANRRASKLLKGTISRVKAQPSSSATGERAKSLALASMRDFAKQLKIDARIIRRQTAGKSAGGLIKRSNKLMKSAAKRSKSARKLFRQAEREAAAPPA